eukprot:TRINITY_DN4152_c0_g1_i1.p1 TRINITY_DN4152_c0_g1~~TRINITY_DN4152_c0_g1_i1.p1  ORF type:complete len:454 (-),score=178.66 TRINITY_DN4152_c0_g1_i1:666-2027(-)
MAVNIGKANADDAFYRYKMPKLQAKIEGRGNGIKTNLVNMVDVAKALDRPASYTTKYFGYELGAQSKFDEKTGTSIVNGAHDATKLAALLENFIKKFVQCYGCGNPETVITITKQQTLQLKCAACGFVSDVDMRDKLTSFILKFPPEEKKKGKGKDKQLRRAEKERLKAGEAADEESKKGKKGSKKKGESDGKAKKKGDSDEDREPSPDVSQKGDEDEDDDDGVEWQTDVSAAAAEARIREQLTAATSEMVMAPVTTNGTEEKEVTPMKEKSAVIKDERNGEVEEQQEASALAELSLHEMLVQDLKDFVPGHDAVAVTAYLQTREETKQEQLNALFEVLADGQAKGVSKIIAKKRKFLAKAVVDEASQKLLIGAIVVYCAVVVPEAVKEVPLVLKVLYDDDVLEEDAILAWFDGGHPFDVAAGINAKAGAAARKAATPFVEWLKNAEPESDED